MGLKEKKNKNLKSKFKYAFQGLKYMLKDKYFVLLLFFLFLVVLFGCLFNVSSLEFSITLILAGMVIALETMNTAIENTIDLVTEEIRPLAKIAKDTAAASVLIGTITAFIVATIIYAPKILEILKEVL